jgi:hypothetical protein
MIPSSILRPPMASCRKSTPPIDLYLHQQGVDATTPAGKAMFQMLGVFAEFERSMIQIPCSLDGINPAHHPEIFGNPAVAASYGFVRSRDGTWQVRPGCRR